MKTVTLTDKQFSTLINGLQTAATKFETNAKEIRMVPPVTQLDEQIASTFDQQAKDTWDLSYVFNTAVKVEVTCD